MCGYLTHLRLNRIYYISLTRCFTIFRKYSRKLTTRGVIEPQLAEKFAGTLDFTHLSTELCGATNAPATCEKSFGHHSPRELEVKVNERVYTTCVYLKTYICCNEEDGRFARCQRLRRGVTTRRCTRRGGGGGDKIKPQWFSVADRVAMTHSLIRIKSISSQLQPWHYQATIIRVNRSFPRLVQTSRIHARESRERALASTTKWNETLKRDRRSE